MAEERPRDFSFAPDFGGPGRFGGGGSFSQPGGPPIHAEGGDMAASRMLTQALGPIAGMLAGMVGLDTRIANAVSSSLGNVLSTRGSITGGTNLGHQAYNYHMERSNREMMTGAGSFTAAVQNGRMQNAQRMLQLASPDMSAAEVQTRARAAILDPLNPLGMAANWAFQEYQIPKLQQGLLATNTLAGMHYKDAGQRKEMRDFQAGLVTAFVNDKFSYGGLEGGDLGQLTTGMAQRGMMTGDAAAMGAKVKDMARALGPLKDLLGGDIPELMDQLEATLGVSLSTFSPAEITTRISKMKYMAAQTGVSIQQVMQMSQSAGAMYDSMGMSRMGADTAATAALGMMTGLRLDRLDPDQFRQTMLRDQVGQQASRAAHDLAGAASILMVRDPGKYETMQAAMDAVMKKVGTDTSIGNIALQMKMDASSIAAAGSTELAEDIRTSTDVGSQLTNSRYADLKGSIAGQLNRYQRARGTTAAMARAYQRMAELTGQEGAMLNEGEMRKKIQGLGLTAQEEQEVLGTYDTISNRDAKDRGWQGGRRQADEAYRGEELRVKRQAMSDAYTATELRLQDSDITRRYGKIGLLMGESSVAAMIAGYMGYSTVNMSEEALEGLKQAGTSDRVADMIKHAAFSIHDDNMDEDAKNRRDTLLLQLAEGSGATAEDISSAAMSIFYKDTEEGKSAGKILGDDAATQKDYFARNQFGRQQMLRKRALEKTISGMEGLSDEQRQKLTHELAQVDNDKLNVRDFISKQTDLDPDQRKGVEDAFTKTMKDAGIDMDKTPSNYLEDILKLLQDYIGANKDPK